MTSLSFLPKFNKITEEEKTINQNTPKKNKINFNDFNSALFMSEYQENEENSSENENKENKIKLSNSNKQKEKEKNFNYNDFKFKYSFDNCLTNELVDTLDKGSNETKKKEKLFKDDLLDKNSSEDFLKISKTLLPQTDTSTKKKYDENNVIKNKNKNIVYQVNINDFEYQLKFIENSLNNILPKTYLKSNINNKNNINEKNISSFNYPNKFNNINSTSSLTSRNEIKANNNYQFVSPFDNNKYNSSILQTNKKNNINYNGNNYNNDKTNYQVHKLKLCNNKCYKWKCKICNNMNMGYCKICINCRKNRKAKY